jgi:ABC-type bacteriocin/lantibiotic exporter with double-glycine peptidase domain
MVRTSPYSNRFMTLRPVFSGTRRFKKAEFETSSLVMNKGSIIEHGSHAELMQKNGFYAELYNSQFAM